MQRGIRVYEMIDDDDYDDDDDDEFCLAGFYKNRSDVGLWEAEDIEQTHACMQAS